MDRLQAMQTFVTVVQVGSFTRAADRLAMSRAGVTQQVQQLEAHLQVRLLNRTTRKLALTADGQRYYPQALQLLQRLEALESGVSGAVSAVRGRLRVDVPSPFASLLLVPALAEFHDSYPGIELELGVSDRKVDLLDEQVDVVVRGGRLDDQALVCRHLADLPLGLYAAPSYLARHGVPASPQELQQPSQRMVRFGHGKAGSGLPAVFQRDGVQVSVAGSSVLTVDDGNACLAAALAGLGVVLMPRYMAAAHLPGGALVALLTQWQAPVLPLHLAWRQNRHPSRRLRVFIDWLVALVARQPPDLALPAASRPLLPAAAAQD